MLPPTKARQGGGGAVVVKQGFGQNYRAKAPNTFITAQNMLNRFVVQELGVNVLHIFELIFGSGAV